jgi:aminoglycoside 3-N-acetyltransferase I
MTLRYARLTSGDGEAAKQVFAVLADEFGEGCEPLSQTYVERLLNDGTFWALAAFDGDRPIGGLTAHAIPMTRSESTELFIYDVAVRSEYQRRGVGRHLIATLRRQAAEAGIAVLFVPADNEDEHALDFYRAIGGEPTPVTFFDFQADPPAGGPQAAR